MFVFSVVRVAANCLKPFVIFPGSIAKQIWDCSFLFCYYFNHTKETVIVPQFTVIIHSALSVRYVLTIILYICGLIEND